MGKYYRQLLWNDRLMIEKMYNKKYSKTEIANIIGFSRATIYRELKKGETAGINSNLKEITFYSCDTAQRITDKNKKRQGAKLKVINDKKLMIYISISKKVILEI